MSKNLFVLIDELGLFLSKNGHCGTLFLKEAIICEEKDLLHIRNKYPIARDLAERHLKGNHHVKSM